MVYSLKNYIGHLGRVTTTGYVVQSLASYIRESERIITNFPLDAGASAEEGTSVSVKVEHSTQSGVNYDVKATVDASKKGEIEASAHGPFAGYAPSVAKVFFDVPVFFEAPADTVTKYSVKQDPYGEWASQDGLDTQGEKKGIRGHVNVAFTPKTWIVQWKDGQDNVVSTDKYIVDLVGVQLKDYEAEATALKVDGSTLTVTLDKALPWGISYTARVEGLEGVIVFEGDGYSTDVVLSTKASAQKTYKLIDIIGDHTVVTGTPEASPAAAAAASVAGPQVMAAPAALKASVGDGVTKVVATETPVKKTATKKTSAKKKSSK